MLKNYAVIFWGELFNFAQFNFKRLRHPWEWTLSGFDFYESQRGQNSTETGYFG